MIDLYARMRSNNRQHRDISWLVRGIQEAAFHEAAEVAMVSATEEQSKKMMAMAVDLLAGGGLIPFIVDDHKIEFPNGSFLHFHPAGPPRGETATLVIIDEAAGGAS